MPAVDVQTITTDTKLFPFTGVTQTLREQSAIPRARVVVEIPQQNLDATNGTTLRGWKAETVLPKNGVYTLVNASLVIFRLNVSESDDQALTSACFFDNSAWLKIVSRDVSLQAMLSVDKVTQNEITNNLSSGGTLVVQQAAGTGAQYATSGNFDPSTGFHIYAKIYDQLSNPAMRKAVFIPKKDDGEVDFSIAAVNMVEVSVPANQYAVVGSFEFLQYDLDQAYNFALHQQIAVR
jgi:hypothetical protein